MCFVFKRTLEETSEIPGQFIVTTIPINQFGSYPTFINNIEEASYSLKLQIFLLEVKIIGIRLQDVLISL